MVCVYGEWDCKNKDYICRLSRGCYCRYDNQEECDNYDTARKRE
jgi:hypothetical protein